MGRKNSKKADFQKVKLRAGRHPLKKGMKVTQTKFKVKKIKVPVQFKPETSEPRVHRHQTITDLLKKAQHTNVSIRHESFLSIGKLLNSQKELVEPHLSALLQVAFSGIYADASSIRIEAVNICRLILESVSEVKVAAFSSIIVPHLCCAMTNIQHAVRTDSLKVLDLCLQAVPHVLISSEKILKNLISQISFEKSQIICNKSGLNVSNMCGKTASERLKSQNWRANVLCSLAKFLKAVNVNLSKKETGYFWPTFYSPIKIPGTGTIKVAEFVDLKSYIAELMPILFGIWCEAAPNPYIKSDSGKIVCAAAANVMDSVLQVIRLICEWIKKVDEKNKNADMITWFNTQYRKKIFARFMVFFPYTQRIPAGRKKNVTDTEISCVTINLAICDVFSMMPPSDSNSSSKLYQQVSDYLLHVINRNNSGGVASVSIIVKILKKLLTPSELESFESHLNGLLKCYNELEVGKKERENFLDFITDLIDIQNIKTVENMPVMKHLAQSLLRDLLKMHQEKRVDKHTLAVMKQLNVIGFLPFVNELQENRHILIELIQSEEIEIQKTAIYFFSRLTHISADYFRELAKVIINSTIPVNIISQLLSILSLGFVHPVRVVAYTGKDYANFLFCVAVGMFKHESDTYMDLAQVERNRCGNTIPFHLSEYAVVASSNLQRHFDIAKAAIRELMDFSDKKQMALCIHTYVVQFTTNCASFPVHSALALLLLECEAYKINQLPDDVDCLLSIAEITIATFLYQIAWEHDRDPAEVPSGSVIGVLLEIVKMLKIMRNVCEIIAQRIREIQDMGEAECIGRLLLVALRKQLLPPEDLSELVCVLQELLDRFGDGIQNEPWWMSINHEISLPPYCSE